MTSWNNRIVKIEEGKYALHEVYYDDNGVIYGWTLDPIDGYFDKPSEIVATLEHQLADAKAHIEGTMEILNAKDLPQGW